MNLLGQYGSIVINPTLASLIGLEEAIVLQQINYWLVIDSQLEENNYNGVTYIPNSITMWQKYYFPFWTEDEIASILQTLINYKFVKVITNPFNKRSSELWYTINFKEVNKLYNLCKKMEDDELEDRCAI